MFVIVKRLLVISLVIFGSHLAQADDKTVCSDSADFQVRMLDSDERINLCEVYQGKVMIIVNTASKCGYTDQYDDLEKLYSEYKAEGLVVLGFPSNDFGGQEPGSEKNIKNFCRLTYGVKFPMFEKSIVKGKNASPLYRTLAQVSGQSPRWNFHKYVIDRNGQLVGQYRSSVEPYDRNFLGMIKQQLQVKSMNDESLEL